MPERALIIAPSWVGDAVMSQVLLFFLKEKNLDIDVLAPEWVAPVYERMSEVHHVVKHSFGHGTLQIHNRFLLGKSLRGKYALSFVLPNSFKSALVPFFAKIPKRVGFTGEARFGLLNHRFALNKSALPKMAERFLYLGSAIDSQLNCQHFRPPHLKAHHSHSLLQKLNLNLPAQGVVIFCPGAEFGPAKRWSAQNFGTLATMLRQYGFAIWLVGSSKDFAIAQEIAQMAPFVQNLCGKTSLGDAINLIHLARLIISNDSGLMHIAAALNKAQIALYGSSSPDFTPPLNAQAHILKIPISCSPCFQRQCPFQHYDCLNKITPQMVFEKTKNILNF